jgi:hypothetical protein
VIDALAQLKTDLIEAAGPNLLGLALFGGLARGSYHPGFSDVNLLVLLAEASTDRLAAIAPALQRGFRAARVEPLILTATELARLAEVFPTKLLDIQEHHRMLYGAEFLGQIDVSREHVRLRIKQELCNLLLRLRRRYVALADDRQALTIALAGAARPLAIELDALLRLAGKPRATDDHTASIFAAAAAAFGLDGGPLNRLAMLRQDQTPPEDVAEIFQQLLVAIARAMHIVDGVEGAAR